MTEHVCFPQWELGTGKVLCRDCDKPVPMTQSEWAEIVQKTLAKAMETHG